MKTVRLDCRNMKTKREAHEYIAKTLCFPDYYGKNLDALYDCLTEFCRDTLIVIRYSSVLKEQLGEYAENLLGTFSDAEKSAAKLSVVVTER